MSTSRPQRQATKTASGFARMLQKPDKKELQLLRNLIHDVKIAKKKGIISEIELELNDGKIVKVDSRDVVRLVTNNFGNPMVTEIALLYIQLVCVR